MTMIRPGAPVEAPAAGDSLPHLSGPSAVIRQVLAAHFLRECPHVVEIGGHVRPVTPFLTHHPLSVLSVDPKTPDYSSEVLNGQPCRVRHVARKFQDVTYDYAARSYGLALLGYSLKPFGAREPLGDLLHGLIDNAKVVVIEHAPDLARAVAQVPSILQRPSMALHCSFDLTLDDELIRDTPFRKRRFHVLHHAD